MSQGKSPFAALEGLKATLPAGQASVPEPKKDAAPVEAFEPKVVVSRSRKGRGGKTVSIVAGVRAAHREPFCRELKKALGCGATVEDDTIVVQGDVGDRIKTWLEARGAKKIVMANA